MRNFKIKTGMFLAASLLLVGCSSDTIVARPTWIDKDIISIDGIKDNKLKSIYDAVKKLGDTNSSVLNRVMYDIAKTQIGEYSKLTKYAELDESLLSTNDEFKNFIKSHKIYQANDTGAIMKDKAKGITETIKFTDEEKLIISHRIIVAKVKQIKEDIAEKLYSEIKGGSYNDTVTKLYDERNFVQHLRKELYKVDKHTSETKYKSGMPILPKKAQNETYVEIVKNYLTLDAVIEGTDPKECRYDDYINRKILPELYKTYLTETYVAEQRYSSLGRSYARKVNMISIPMTTDTAYNVTEMLYYFAQKNITGEKFDSPIEIKESYNLETINKAMLGFNVGIVEEGTTDISDLHKALNYTISNEKSEEKETSRTNFAKIRDSEDKPIRYHCRTDLNGIEYEDPYSKESTEADNYAYTFVYEGTKLGEMMKKLMTFAKIVNNGTKETFVVRSGLSADEEKVHLEFTNNNAQSLEKSIVLREQEARATDYTKDGWYLKNGGLTDLDSTLRDNLFSISTSTVLDDYSKLSGNSTYTIGEHVKYFGSIKDKGDATKQDVTNRKAFLTTSANDPWKSVVLFNKDNTNASIIEVQEAVNSSKLSTATNKRNYYHAKTYLKPKTDTEAEIRLASADAANEIAKDVIKACSSNDTYKKNANEYYLMISNIIFYDQSVYDYFKSQFPDLFK